MRGRSVSGVLRSGKDDPVCEVGNQMHGIQDHHASPIVSEAGFEVDGGFLLRLIVILADHLDDWIGDHTGEQSRGDGSVFVASSSGHFSSVPQTTGIGRSL